MQPKSMCLMLKRVPQECSEEISPRTFIRITIRKACFATGLFASLGVSSKWRVLCMIIV